MLFHNRQSDFLGKAGERVSKGNGSPENGITRRPVGVFIGFKGPGLIWAQAL